MCFIVINKLGFHVLPHNQDNTKCWHNIQVVAVQIQISLKILQLLKINSAID